MRTYSTTLLSMYAVLAATTAPAANADDDDECPHGYSSGFYCGSYPGMPTYLSVGFPNVLFYCEDGTYWEEEDCGADGGACVQADAGEEDYCSYEEPDVDTAEEEEEIYIDTTILIDHGAAHACKGDEDYDGGLHCGDSDDRLYRCYRDGRYGGPVEDCRATHGGSTSFGVCVVNPDPDEDDYCDDPPPVAEADAEADADAAPVGEAPVAGAGQDGGSDLPLLHSDVRLKMFWDEDYYWQESSDEAWWCVERDVDGDDCWHYNDREVECDENKVYIMECGSTSRQRWDFVDVTEPGGVTEVLIRATGEDNRCLRRDGYGDDDVELVYECNPADAMQRWAAVRGDFNGEKFELGRADDDEAEFCLSQAHHPKEGEDVRMYDCDDERDGDTSYWVIW